MTDTPDTVTDASGRKIGVMIFGPEDMLDLMEAADDLSTNQGWLRYATVICSVSSIDDVPVPRPKNKMQIRGIAKKLGNLGFLAVAKAIYPGDEEQPPSETQDATPAP